MRWLIRILNMLERFLPPRRIKVIEGGELPKRLPLRNIVLLRDTGEDWSLGMRCPCGCGQLIELALIPEANTRWKLDFEMDKSPTLTPSIWLREGCRSHFFVRHGRVEWVKRQSE